MMAKKRFLEEIKLDAARFYRTPGDVLRDRRFSDTERLEILECWERDARSVPQGVDDETLNNDRNLLESIIKVRTELERKVTGEI